MQVVVSGAGGRQRATSSWSPAILTDTNWKPFELEDQPARGASDKELHMVLVSEGGLVRGFSGCNACRGSNEVNGNQPGFSTLVSTMHACIDGVEQAQHLQQMTQQAKLYETTGGNLSFYGEGDRVLLRFLAACLY